MTIKYNIVTGLGRSGTSLMMLCLRQSGIPVIGSKYYCHVENLKIGGKDMDLNIWLPPNEKTEQINKNGFWELPQLAINNGLTDDYKCIGFEGDLIKVFSNAIVKSNPDLIDKAIVMVRDPKRTLASKISAGEIDVSEASLASVMLAGQLEKAIEFLEKNNKKYMVVCYDDLLEQPKKILKKVCKFLGRGDWRYGVKMIDKKLNRSAARDDLGDISKLEEMHKKLISKT